MAGDWIKLDKSTIDKPEIAILARRLNVSHAEAVVSFLRMFIWADSNVNCPGFVPDLSPEDLDTLSRCVPGTTAALASGAIKWLQITDNGIQFVNWDRHNGKSAKSRSYEAEKKRKQRSSPGKCPQDTGTNVPDEPGQKWGPEKRREDINTPLPPKGGIDGFNEGRRSRDKWPRITGRSEQEVKTWIRLFSEDVIPRDKTTVTNIMTAAQRIQDDLEFYRAVERIANGGIS